MVLCQGTYKCVLSDHIPQVEVAERVEGWKARQWARKLDQLAGQNAEQFKGLAAARTRILDLEQAVAAVQLKHKAGADKQALLRKPTSQVCISGTVPLDVSSSRT